MKKCTTYTIGQTTIEKTNDDFSESYNDLGKYTNEIGPGIIIREYDEFYERIPVEMERNDDGTFYGKKDPLIHRYNNNEYPAFKPYAGGEKIGTKNYYKYGMADYDRMESYNNCNWCYIGIIIKTEVTTDIGLSSDITESLFGIESDCTDYHKTVIEDLKHEVKYQLLKMGFNENEIDLSLDNANEVD